MNRHFIYRTEEASRQHGLLLSIAMLRRSTTLWYRCFLTAICLFTLVSPSGASTPWDGSTTKQPDSWQAGNTTLYISDATELAWLAATVNSGEQTGTTSNDIGFKGCTVVLTDNIDLNQKPWTPIGTTTPFAGSLDGQGYTISNLFIKTDDPSAGLFSEIKSQPSENAFIRNLRVAGIIITKQNCGLLAASVTGTDLLNINVEGTVDNTEGHNSGIGLLAGDVTECDILNCVAVGELNSLSLGGGLVGTANIKASSSTRIQNCGVYITQSNAYSTTGGLFCMGETSPAAPLYLKNNYVVAANLSLPPILSITDENFNSVDLKQFPVGVYTNPDYLNLGGSLLNTQSNVGCCMWEETIFSSKKVPCLDFTRLAELSPGYWAHQAIAADISTTGNDIETDDSPSPTSFKVKTVAGLAWIAFICNGGNMNNDLVPADLSFKDCTVELSDDLDLQKQEWTPIGNVYPFNGIFEGNGKTLKNLSILKIGENNGLFSQADKQSDIRNLTLEGATLTGTVGVNNPIDGSIQAGTIAGASDGQINNCHTEGGQIRITFKESLSSHYIGGLVGNGKNCKIADCSNANLIEIKDPNYICQLLIGGISSLLYTQTLNCYNTGSLNMEGQGILGGIGGMAMALENCYNSGKIDANVSEAYTHQPTLSIGGIAGEGVGYIANCYSTGDITAEGNLNQKDAPIAAGGICGMVQPFEGDSYGYIDNCFATGSVRSAAYAGGIAGISLMKTAPSVKINHCLALNPSVTGDEKKTARITPNIDPSLARDTYTRATIDGCYAYVGMLLNGNLLSVNDDKKPDAIHGADWTTYLADAPMKDWTAGAWNFTPPLRATNITGLMPLLNQIKPETYQYNSAQTSSTKEFRNLLITGQTAVPIPYTLTIAASTHGSVAIENGSLTGFVGREILLTVQPDNGYKPDQLSYTTKDIPTPVAITQNSNGKYSFTMPAGNATIAATFRTKELEALNLTNQSTDITISKEGDIWKYLAAAITRSTPTPVAFNGIVTGTLPKGNSILIAASSKGRLTFDNAVIDAENSGTALSIAEGADITIAGTVDAKTADSDSPAIQNNGNITTESGASITAINSGDATKGISVSSEGTLFFSDNSTLTASGLDNQGTVVAKKGATVKSDTGNDDLLKTYTVTITVPGNGNTLTVKTSDITITTGDKIAKNTKITLTATAAEYYSLQQITVIPKGEAAVNIANNETYTMPAKAITIAANFNYNPPAPTTYTVTLPFVEGATTNPSAGDYEVEEWDKFRFSLTLDADYDKSEPVVTTSRNETIAPRSSDGAYIVKNVRTDIVISISGIVKNPAPVANIELNAGSRITVRKGVVFITVDRTTKAQVVTFGGQTIRSLSIPAGETRIDGLAKGAYIVRLGNSTTQKVIVN